MNTEFKNDRIFTNFGYGNWDFFQKRSTEEDLSTSDWLLRKVQLILASIPLINIAFSGVYALANRKVRKLGTEDQPPVTQKTADVGVAVINEPPPAKIEPPPAKVEPPPAKIEPPVDLTFAEKQLKKLWNGPWEYSNEQFSCKVPPEDAKEESEIVKHLSNLKRRLARLGLETDEMKASFDNKKIHVELIIKDKTKIAHLAESFLPTIEIKNQKGFLDAEKSIGASLLLLTSKDKSKSNLLEEIAKKPEIVPAVKITREGILIPLKPSLLPQNLLVNLRKSDINKPELFIDGTELFLFLKDGMNLRDNVYEEALKIYKDASTITK